MAIDRERISHGMSHRELCAKSGVSHATLPNALNNSTSINMSTAIKLLGALGMRLEVRSHDSRN